MRSTSRDWQFEFQRDTMPSYGTMKAAAPYRTRKTVNDAPPQVALTPAEGPATQIGVANKEAGLKPG
jgi:hypothetical protein